MPISQVSLFLISVLNSAITVSQMHIPSKKTFQKAVDGVKNSSVVNRVEYIEDIYFFQVNTKYISSSAVKTISIFHECVARVKMLIFSPHEMKYILYLP